MRTPKHTTRHTNGQSHTQTLAQHTNRSITNEYTGSCCCCCNVLISITLQPTPGAVLPSSRTPVDSDARRPHRSSSSPFRYRDRREVLINPPDKKNPCRRRVWDTASTFRTSNHTSTHLGPPEGASPRKTLRFNVYRFFRYPVHTFQGVSRARVCRPSLHKCNIRFGILSCLLLDVHTATHFSFLPSRISQMHLPPLIHLASTGIRGFQRFAPDCTAVCVVSFFNIRL